MGFKIENQKSEILIVGAGVIGLSLGWELARGGQQVTILERDKAGQGTSRLAAGMLAPASEIGFEELDLYALGRESLRRWPDFARRLESDSGVRVDYRTEGTLVVADDPDSRSVLRRLYEFQRQHGVPVEWLTGAEALEIEPFLAPRLAAAVFSPEDHQVDNHLLLHALKSAFHYRGGALREHTRVQAIQQESGKPVVLVEGERIMADVVILAAGVWSGGMEGLEPHRPPVRPVKGQMVELKMQAPFALSHVVRGPGAYLAPKSSGRLLVGATTEEMGFDTTVTAGGLYAVLEGGWEVVPGIYDLEVTNTWAGLRPASRDHAPILGPVPGRPGVMFATGHYRHGILLAPVTAEEVARMLRSGETSPWLHPFLPGRFGTTH